MLKSFEPAIREGKAMGIMAAYHDIDGVPCTGNPWLLNQVLRDEWGFKVLFCPISAPSAGFMTRIMSLIHRPTPCCWRSIPAWICSFMISTTMFFKTQSLMA